jgi:hypothetical protein
MIHAGWLLHTPDAEDDGEWQLTAKGKFEGGIYRDSKKFGHYIVWPASVLEHPAINDVKDIHISASGIAKQFEISAKMLNRLLAEMGWISAYAKGWKMTPLGQAHGAKQASNDDTGVPYVLWPRELVQQPELIQRVATYKGQGDTLMLNGEKHWVALDGRHIACPIRLRIAHYLYLHGFHYAYQRSVYLTKSANLVSDFYLPKYALHIHYQDQHISPSELKTQLERQQLAQAHSLSLITLQAETIESLEQHLSKALLQAGVSDQ